MAWSLGYREVIPDQTATEKWIEFSLNTGGTQSTLQDIKVAERSGGYAYKHQSKYFTRNRFIYWRISHDVLELVEQSLDVNLTGNKIRYRFVDTPILEGITIHEAYNSVVILIATVSSIHRLSFPHPDIIHNQEHIFPRLGVEYTAKSIFAEATVNDARNPATFHVINHASTNSPLPHTSATGLSWNHEHFLFALAYNTGFILLFKMDSMTGRVNCLELKQQYDALIMPRFISRALRGKNKDDEITVNMLFHGIASETYLFALCRDGNVRLWSTLRNQCNIVTDITPAGNEGAQNHMIRKAIAPDQIHFSVAVLLCFTNHSIIQILEPTVESSSFRLELIKSIYTPKDLDLVDFTITYDKEIWAVFRSPQGETCVSFHKGKDWIPCILENSLDRVEIPLDLEIEPKQNYIDFIFHPGRFPISVINKALSIYRKSNIITDIGIPMHVLKERVCAVVDAEINAEMEERNYSEEEAVELINSCWQKFYSCCVEYYESGTRPIGLLTLAHRVPKVTDDGDARTNFDIDRENDSESSDSENGGPSEGNGEMITSGVVIIKKNYVSLIRPMDLLESVALNTGTHSELVKTNLGSFVNSFNGDLLKLVKMLIYLDDNLPDDLKMCFDKSLKQLKSPMTTIVEIFDKNLNFEAEDTFSNMDLLYNIAVNLENIEDVEALMTNLLDLLDVGQPDLSEGYDKIENTRWLINLGHLFGSQFATSFVSNSLQQIVLVRYELCRCLLIFQRLLLKNAFEAFISSQRLSRVSETILERTSSLTQCYHLLVWMTQTPVHLPQTLDSLENCVSILKLNEVKKNSLLQTSFYQLNRNVTILELFLQSTASTTVRLLLSKREIEQQHICLWHKSLLPYIHILSQLIWPICNNTVFPEFLLFSAQYLHVQEYTRLLSKWCHSNSYTRKFLLGCALLDSGERDKAFDVFHKAAHGVNIDDFIKLRVLQVDRDLSRERLVVLYYLKIVKLFEQQNAYDLIISLAKHAIEVAEKDEPELATLYSIVFLNRVRVGRFEEAYEALVANPDNDRRKDCLRQLVVTLFDNRMLSTLIDFSFAGMQNDLERIIEGRARSLDVMNNEYYNFLYSFHTLKGSMRKAACVMYEQALRLSVYNMEADVRILEKQCRCYTSTINSLNLVKKEDAWIVKPLPTDEDVELDRQMVSKQLKRDIEVVELKDVEKEYSLCTARLKLMKFSPENSNKISSTLNAHEVMGVLSNVGLYKDALGISSLYGIPANSIVSHLATTCVRLDETHLDSAWDWLPENYINDLGDGSASSIAWRLLQSLINKHEMEKQSSLHKSVTSKLLQLGVFLPHWLVASYKLRNPGELLRLLLENGRLEESGLLAVEYLEATLGRGKDRLNIESSILPQNPATWLPFNTIDLILLELEAHSQNDPVYKELHNNLSDVLEVYLQTAATVSEDKIRIFNRD